MHELRVLLPHGNHGDRCCGACAGAICLYDSCTWRWIAERRAHAGAGGKVLAVF